MTVFIYRLSSPEPISYIHMQNSKSKLSLGSYEILWIEPDITAVWLFRGAKSYNEIEQACIQYSDNRKMMDVPVTDN